MLRKPPRSRPITDGARLLRAYLDGARLSVSKFCVRYHLDRITVQRVLKGERSRISVDFAYQVEKATQGEVPWYSWRSATAKVSGSPRARAA